MNIKHIDRMETLESCIERKKKKMVKVRIRVDNNLAALLIDGSRTLNHA